MPPERSGKKKQFSDYPQLNFRVSKETHAELTEKIEQARKAYNAKRANDELRATRGDVAADALRFGLSAILKEKGPLASGGA